MPKLALDPTKSPAQARLMQAAARTPGGYGGVPQSVGKEFVGKDAPFQAAGTMFVAPGGSVLWVKKPPKGDYLGEWVFPGGKIEDGETAEQAAAREANEELNYVPEGEAIRFHRGITDRGVDYTTMVQFVPGEFQVVLNNEHVAWAWAPLGDPPQPCHPGILAMIEQAKAITGDDLTTAPNSALPAGVVKRKHGMDCLAFDRESVRTKDPLDGHLHIASSVVSAAQVNDYRMEEIPNAEALGLVPGRVYALLRDPIELEKAAQTMHGKPLVIVHRAQTASDHDRTIVVGAVHNPVWEAPNLKAEITVWDGEAIALIESDEQSDLSSGYGYRADMTPGEFNGVAYEGVMRDISFNHISLVSQGRVIGAFVGDSINPEEHKIMKVVRLSRTAAVAKGALLAYLRPVMAADAKINLDAALADVNAKNLKAKRPDILAAITKSATSKLAKDAKLEPDKLALAFDAAEAEMEAEDAEEKEDEEAEKERKAKEGKDKRGKDGMLPGKAALDDFLKEKLSKDDYKSACDMMEGEDETKEEKEKREAKDKAARDKGGKDGEEEEKVSKKAMDAALKATASETAKSVRETERGIRAALANVRPWVGELAPTLALDSAEDVYRHAAGMLKIAGSDKMHPDALWPVIQSREQPGARRQQNEQNGLAFDAASLDVAKKMAPGVDRIIVGA
jgi:8-oxo-dGTP pyrophosphatase MutT (NUDIX family)